MKTLNLTLYGEKYTLRVAILFRYLQHNNQLVHVRFHCRQPYSCVSTGPIFLTQTAAKIVNSTLLNKTVHFQKLSFSLELFYTVTASNFIHFRFLGSTILYVHM